MVPKLHHPRRLTIFHNHCIRTILGVIRYQKWKERISSRQLSRDFGMEGSIADIIVKHRLCSLGRMELAQMPKQLLFGELEKTRPKDGTNRRWRDVVSANLHNVVIEDRWYQLSQDRQAWFTTCTDEIRMKVEQQNGREHMARSHSCPCGGIFCQQGGFTWNSHFCSGAGTTD